MVISEFLQRGGAERKHRQEGERDQDQRDTGNHADELRSMRRQGADGLRGLALFGQGAGQGEHEDDRQEPAEHHGQAERGVVPVGVDGDTRECRPLLLAAEVKA